MLTAKQISANIATISRASQKIRDMVQETLIQCAGHAYQHGDVTLYTKLIAVTSGANQEAIARWIKEYGFAVLQKDGTFKLNKAAQKDADFDDGEAVIDYLTHESAPWYTMGKSLSQIAKDLNVASRIKALTTQIQNAPENDRHVVINAPEIRAAMEAFNEVLKQAARDKRNIVAVKSEAEAA